MRIRRFRRHWQYVSALAVVCTAACALPGVATEVDPPVPATLRTLEGETVRGRITAYDRQRLTLITRDQEQRDLAWADLPPDRVLWVHQRVLARDDARAWFELAVDLYPRENGERYGERALRLAVRADPSLEELAQRLRDGEVVTWPEAEPDPAPETDPADEGDADTDTNGEAGEAAEEAPDANGPPDAADEPERAGPLVEGETQEQFWGELSPELMASSVEALKHEAEEAQEKLRIRLRLYEDPNFLVYTDLPAEEAKNWVGLLDDMYDRLVETFGLPEGQNVFRGKCLIYIFAQEGNYLRFCAETLGFNAVGTAGVCVSRGDGFAVVAFYRQPNTLDFAHILVHESVHAFVHRYRSYPHVPSWINEGLAEYISHRLVSNRGFGESTMAKYQFRGRQYLRYFKSLRGMLDAPHIAGWQYPVAGELCAFMIQQSPKRYKAFIDGIKDGKSWRVALREDYGLTPEQLVSEFGRFVNVPRLTQ